VYEDGGWPVDRSRGRGSSVGLRRRDPGKWHGAW